MSDFRIRKIQNGYVLCWEEQEDGAYGPAYLEYYAQSVEDLLQRLRTLVQGQ